MPKYLDGFVTPVPKKNLPAYRRMARMAGKILLELGALQFCESIGDELNVKMGIPFPKLIKPKAGEVVMFSFIVYKSKADRNRVMKKFMMDPRFEKMMDGKEMPFDMKRMSSGGFKVIVEA